MKDYEPGLPDVPEWAQAIVTLLILGIVGVALVFGMTIIIQELLNLVGR